MASVGTARMCAEEGRPFNTVGGRCYKWLQREGQPDCYIPLRQQVSKDVKTLYEKAKERLASELQVRSDLALNISLTCKFSRPMMVNIALVFDCWTSPNHRPWMSIDISRLQKMTMAKKCQLPTYTANPSYALGLSGCG